ncbi:putative folate-biopterin transporter 9, chloroplastic, partial [Mucuna pruriens]
MVRSTKLAATIIYIHGISCKWNLRKLDRQAMFVIFSSLLSLQLAISYSTREEYLGMSQLLGQDLTRKSILENIRKRVSDLVTVISDEHFPAPCIDCWINFHGRNAFSGLEWLANCCFFGTQLYNHYWKKTLMRKLISMVQILYVSSLLLDLVLIKQINLKQGIPNKDSAFLALNLSLSSIASAFSGIGLASCLGIR